MLLTMVMSLDTLGVGKQLGAEASQLAHVNCTPAAAVGGGTRKPTSHGSRRTSLGGCMGKNRRGADYRNDSSRWSLG